MAAAYVYVPGAMPAFDRNGGATSAALYFYLHQTQTPLTVFTSAALTTPHAFPVLSNDAGVFPDIWLDSAVAPFDVTFTGDNADPISIESLTPALFIQDGPAGPNGWTPIFAIAADGMRRVQQVTDWTGGTGTKPAVGVYVGSTGFVGLISDGADIRGASGAGSGNVNSTGTIVAGRGIVYSDTSGTLIQADIASTGSGAPVRASSPTLTTPSLGTPSAISLSNATNLPLASGVTGTLAVSNGGTGATTLTDGGVLLGNGTGAVQATSAGTAGQVLTSNGAGVDPSFQSAASGSLVLLDTKTASASTSLDFTVLSSAYDDYEFVFVNLVANSAVQILMRVSIDGGATYEAGANYSRATIGGTTSGQSAMYASANATGPTALTSPLSGKIRLCGVNGGAAKPMFGEVAHQSSTPGLVSGAYTGSAVVNAVRFQASGDTLTSGLIRCYGVKT